MQNHCSRLNESYYEELFSIQFSNSEDGLLEEKPILETH